MIKNFLKNFKKSVDKCFIICYTLIVAKRKEANGCKGAKNKNKKVKKVLTSTEKHGILQTANKK